MISILPLFFSSDSETMIKVKGETSNMKIKMYTPWSRTCEFESLGVGSARFGAYYLLHVREGITPSLEDCKRCRDLKHGPQRFSRQSNSDMES